MNEDEIDTLNRFVVVFLETAELRAKNRQDLTINFWEENVNKIIKLNDKILLKGKGSISHEEMRKKLRIIYSKFNIRRKKEEAIYADNLDEIELKQLEEKVKESKKRPQKTLKEKRKEKNEKKK